MKISDHDTANPFGSFEGAISKEDARKNRTRQAPADLPEPVREQINEHRQEREEDREILVQQLYCYHETSIKHAKDDLLRGEGRFEPAWVTKVNSVLFAENLERTARRQAEESDRKDLREFDNDTRRQEIDILQRYEMSLQSKSVLSRARPSHESTHDREPGRER